MTSLVCGILKRNEMNELPVSRGKNVREEIVWEIEIDMYALVYLQWITNKDLL